MSEGSVRPRIAPLPAADWGDAEHAAVAALYGVAPDAVPRAGSGGRADPAAFNVLATLVRHPDLARSFLAFNRHLLESSDVPVRVRELAILRVALRGRSAYEWAQHVRIALRAGITQAEIDAVGRGNDAFDGLDRDVLDATDELLAAGRVGDATWTRLAASLDTHQLMDLIFTVGTYVMLAMAFESFGLQPEADATPLPDVSED